ncbi:immunoglobulin-like domain-containing protein [Solibacillus sp. CAU 1738]|uniref:immunoglobulin-like domain-containing protein n=1 Tax=Solibacillus sp. CAU 1738 TaxID=3140363 RepID=UPI00326183BB
MRLRNILVLFIGITMLFSACSNKVTDSGDESLVRKSEYGELPNKLYDQQTKIEVTTDKIEYSTEVNELIFKIENTGTTAFGFGVPLYIEKLINGNWYQIPYRENLAFADIALGIVANSDYVQSVPLEHLDYQLIEGKYRIIKVFNVNGGKFVLGAEFEIKD